MSKSSYEVAESTLVRFCEWRGLNCYFELDTEGHIAVEGNTVYHVIPQNPAPKGIFPHKNKE